VTAGAGGGDKRDGAPPASDLQDDPLLRPASDAGWDEAAPARPAAPRGPSFPAFVPSAAADAARPAAADAARPAFVPPAAADAARPATSDAARPATSDAARPAADAAKPATSDTTKPATSDTTKPATSDTTKPATSATTKPTTSDTAKPAASDTAKPAASDTAKPAASDTAKPAASDTKRPATDAAGKAAAPGGPAKAKAGSAASATITADNEPLVPATYDEDELRAAVGATPRPGATKRRAATSEHDDDEADDLGRPRNRKAVAAAAVAIAAVVGIAALVILGRVNSGRYLLLCEAERAVPQQGRSFPPWGEHPLAGDQWRPLKIAPETRCQPHETDDAVGLARTFLAMVLDQATALLTAHEVTRLDEAEALLKQALLLTRPPEYEPPPLAAERTEHHNEIERLLGDVTYWRATAKLRDAAAALTEAARQFDSAAAQHPRHAADAPAWATYARKLGEELQGGPAGAPRAVTAPAAAGAPATAATAATAAPPGVALPVEPAKGSAEESPATAPPDAGVPAGGVLL